VPDDLFGGFASRRLTTERGEVFAREGGAGPAILLLHGYPQTHVMWRDAARLLADRFTVVAADLPGYGASFRPVAATDHGPHAKRALAADLVQAMSSLGHERFAVVGHDRGGRVAYRMALDHPDRVSAVAVLDVVPTGEDYRAGATIDRAHDDADLGQRRIACPVLALWSAGGALPRLYGDVLDVWRPWADDVSGQGLPTTHFLVEDSPELVADALSAFLTPHLTPSPQH
jgi:pimeloyl-ACP methyl ester carboxylesterase